jgi:hypothetical protein
VLFDAIGVRMLRQKGEREEVLGQQLSASGSPDLRLTGKSRHQLPTLWVDLNISCATARVPGFL